MIDKLNAGAGLENLPLGRTPSNSPRAIKAVQRLLWSVVVVLTGAVGFAGPVEDYDVAIKHYQAKRYDLAAAGFADFIKENPSHERRPAADLYYGQSLMYLKRFADAQLVFGDFQQTHPSHPDLPLAMYRQAECTFFLNDPTTAVTLFDAFLAKFPENDLSAWAWYYLGESHLKLNNAERAATAFQEGLAKFPKSPRATESQFGLARAYQSLKDVDKAAAAFKAISEDSANPRAADALFYLGSMEFDAKRFAEAAAAFSSLVEKFPEYRQAPEAAMNAGASYFELGNFGKAADAFDKAAKSPKDRLNARFWTAQARRRQGNFDEAVAINKDAYNEFRDKPEFKNDATTAKLLYYWGDCEFRLGHTVEALQLFQELADNYPSHEFADDSLHYAVESALKAGQLDQAETLHRRFERDYARTSGLRLLEDILYGRVQLAKAESLSPNPPISPEARALLVSAADTFDAVSRQSKLDQTIAWSTLLHARAKSKLGDWQGVITAATPLNERLDALAKPEEYAESLYLTGVAASELQQWTLADASFDRYLKYTKDPKNLAAALSQLVLARTKAGRLEQLDELWPRFAEAGILPADQAKAVQAAAAAAMDQQRFGSAAKLYERLEGTPDAPGLQAVARSGLGHARFNLKEYLPAAEAFARLTAAPPTDDPVLVANAAFMRGHSLEKGGAGEQAANAYIDGALLIAGKDGRLADPPANAEAAVYAYRCIKNAATQLESLNEIARANDAYSQAWEYLRKLPAEQQGELDSLVYRWASANYVARKFDEADKLFQLLLREHPMSSHADEATFYLTESMLSSGKVEEARAELKRLLESPTTDEAIRPEILHNLIELTADQEDWAATRGFATQLLDQFPASKHRGNARYRQAEATLKSNDVPVARQMFADLRSAVASGEVTLPSDSVTEGVWILSAEAEMAGDTRDYAEIDRLAAEFHEKFPASKLTYQMDAVHGRSLLRRAPPDVEKARMVLQSVVDSPDASGTVTAAAADLRIAESYLLANKPEELETAYRRFFDIYVKYNDATIQPAALLKAGEVQEQRKLPDSAVMAYRELIEKFPMSPQAEAAKERLKALKADVPAPAGGTPMPEKSPQPAPTEPSPGEPSAGQPAPAEATPPAPPSSVPSPDLGQ